MTKSLALLGAAVLIVSTGACEKYDKAGASDAASVTAAIKADEKAWNEQFKAKDSDVEKWVFLTQLHDSNEVLFYRLVGDHVHEMLPIVYTPTVGAAIEQFSHLFRRPRGLFLNIEDPDGIERSLAATGLGPDDIDLVVASDAEAILGIGDWGVNGIEIAVRKLALWTAGGGIDPRRTIAVSLDVGTDNEQLLNDPFYLVNRHPRRRGALYDEFIKNYIQTVNRLFPQAILHFEDFGPANARAILDDYGADYCVFNDDVQGTGAVVMAALYSAVRVTGIPMREQQVVVFGAATAGLGIADQVRDAMVAEGATVEQANARTWPIDRAGLLFDDMDDLRDFQKPYAKNRALLGVSTDEPVALVEVIKTAAPTILLGSSTVHGAFTREVIEAMAASTPRPVIMQLSNPTSHMEAVPDDVLASSEGTTLVATGSPVAPVQYNDTTYRIGQSNNVLVFLGIGRGIIISGARRVTKNILDAAAKAVAGKADPIGPGEALLPDLENLREIATAVAAAVYHAAVEDGVATRKHHDLVQAILNTMGVPEYQTGEEI